MALAQGGWMQREQLIGGRAVAVQLWADDRTRGNAAIATVMAEVQRVDRRFSGRRSDAETALVNAAAAAQAVPVSDEFFQLLLRAQELSRLTLGAFDITCAAAAVLHGEPGASPLDELRLARAVQAGGWRQLQLDAVTPAVRFARQGLRIGFGNLARAHAVDRCCGLLQRMGIRHAQVSVGGCSRLLGDRRGEPWRVALRDPQRAGAVLAWVSLQDVAVSTVAEPGPGLRASLLIDPRSGRLPAPGGSVTVVARDSVSAEAWRQALTVLGAAQGLPLLESVPQAAGLVIDDQGQWQGNRGFKGLKPAVAA